MVFLEDNTRANMLRKRANDPSISIEELDKNIKNKFKWNWLDEEVTFHDSKSFEHKIYLRDIIEKSTTCRAGHAWCKICCDELNYGSSGKKALRKHVLLKKHISKWQLRYENQQIHISKGLEVATTSRQDNPVVTLGDRVANSQAMILGVIAEHSLPFTMSPVLINLSKELAKDQKALNSLAMDRTTASYKMQYGLKKTVLDQTLENIRGCLFSLNIDEAMSNNHKKVLAILVSYFDTRRSKVVIEHLSSIEVIKVDSATLFDKLSTLFKEFSIPWENLVSILMDSCAVMRGSKTGLEKRIRDERAPHLLNIDGDICHHVHNATKKFCSPFGNWLEAFFSDLHTDFKWSTESRDYLAEMCELLGLKFTMPERFISHRWVNIQMN